METTQYSVGHKFISRSNRKFKRIETITDIHTTFNLANEMVKLVYITEHKFCGQMVTGSVCAATIAMGETIDDDANKEMIGSDSDYFNNAGYGDFGNK